MARKRKQSNVDQLGLLEARVATAPLVPGIREKVKAWREDGYNGISDTTRILLNYWFYTDHRLPNGRKFAYHYFQREAVETLIYLYEVTKVRRHKNLVETFATRSNLRLLQYDDFGRYCVKMATGSGKTKVISLAIAWQFFNAVLAPKVREFLEAKAFGGPVLLSDPAMIKAISSNVAQYVTVKTFVEALRKMVISELEPQLLHPGRPLSETPPFPWSRATFAADKCIFNLVPCDNEFEKEFAQFLQKAPAATCRSLCVSTPPTTRRPPTS